MTIKSDSWIESQCLEHNMIHPFTKDTRSDGIISFGLSSYSYDIRVANEFRLFPQHSEGNSIDPKNFDKRVTVFKEEVSNSIYIPPHGFALARSYEYIKMPKDCIATVTGKSTYARCGLSLDHTVLQPGWEGHITLELTNSTSIPIKVYVMEGIAQLIFFQSDEECNESYSDRNGKYNKQTGITFPKINNS